MISAGLKLAVIGPKTVGSDNTAEMIILHPKPSHEIQGKKNKT